MKATTQHTKQIACACGCGAKFIPKNEWHKFYSNRCRQAAWMARNFVRITKAK